MKKWAVYTKWHHSDGINDHQAMRDHMHAVDERIERMCSTLRKLDANYRDGQLPALRDEDFADILDENDTGCPGLGHTAQERSSPSPESSTTRNS